MVIAEPAPGANGPLPSGEGPLVPPVSREAVKKTEAERKTERKAKATETFSATLQTQALEKFGNGQDKTAAIAAVDTQAEEAWKNQRRNEWAEQEGTLQAEIAAATNSKGEEEKKAIATRLRQEKEAQWRKDWANSLAGTNPEDKFNADIYKNRALASDPVLQKLGFTGTTKQDLAEFLQDNFYREYCGKGGTQKLANKLMGGINIAPDADNYDAITVLRQQIDASPLLTALYNNDKTFQAACMKLSVELRTSAALGVIDDLKAHAQDQEPNGLRTTPFDEQKILTALGDVDAERAKISAKIDAAKQAEIAKQKQSREDEEEPAEGGREPESDEEIDDVIASEATIWIHALHGTPEARQALYQKYRLNADKYNKNFEKLLQYDLETQAAEITHLLSENTFMLNDMLDIPHNQGALREFEVHDLLAAINGNAPENVKKEIEILQSIYLGALLPKLGIDLSTVNPKQVNDVFIRQYQLLIQSLVQFDLDPTKQADAKAAYENFCKVLKIEPDPENFDTVAKEWMNEDERYAPHFLVIKEDKVQGYYNEQEDAQDAYAHIAGIVFEELEATLNGVSGGVAEGGVSNNLTPADVLFEGAPGASGELFDKPGQELNIADNPNLYKERIVLVRTTDGNVYAIDQLRRVIDTIATEQAGDFVNLGDLSDETFNTLDLHVDEQLTIRGIDNAPFVGKQIQEIAAVRMGAVPINFDEEIDEARRTGSKKISDVVAVYRTRTREAERNHPMDL